MPGGFLGDLFGSKVDQLPTSYDLTGLEQQIPALGKLNKTASNDILSNLSGTLSPGTQNALQNSAAEYGTSSGMAGGATGMSGLDWNKLYGNIAGASQAEQSQGLQQLNPFVANTSATQTYNPSEMMQLNFQNAVDKAAPDPAYSGIMNLAMGGLGTALGGASGGGGGGCSC